VESNSVCNHTSDNIIGRPRSGSPICHNHKNYNFQEKKNTKVRKGKIYIKSFYIVSMAIETKVVIGWFKWQLKMGLVNLNYNFECDWLIELSDNKLPDNKLSDNNLTSELVENRSFFKPITIEEIVIFLKDYACYRNSSLGWFGVRTSSVKTWHRFLVHCQADTTWDKEIAVLKITLFWTSVRVLLGTGWSRMKFSFLFVS